MKLVSRIRHAVARAAAGAMTAAAQRFSSWLRPGSFLTRDRGWSASETFHAGVSRITNSMGSLPCSLFDSENKKVSVPASEALLNYTNPNMHFHRLIKILETFRNRKGNGIALIEYDRFGQPEGFWPVNPSRVTPLIESATRDLWYGIIGADGQSRYVHSSAVIHVMHIPTDAAVDTAIYWGVSPMDVLKGTLEFDTKVREFTLDQVENAVKASFILNINSLLDPDKKQDMLDSFKAFYRENGGVLLEESGTKITPIEQKAFLDTKMLDVDKVTRRRVYEVLGLPDPDASSYNTREQEQLRYLQETILPIVVEYEDEFNRKVLTPQQRAAGLRFKFNLYALLRADVATQGEFFFRMIRCSVYSPHRVLQLMDEPTYEGADQHYISKDLVPVEKKGN